MVVTRSSCGIRADPAKSESVSGFKGNRQED